MNKKLGKVKKLVEKECEDSGFVPKWFFDEHLKVVNRNAKWILKKVPEADKEVVLLGSWLHDMQRVRGLKIDHQKGGAQEAEKIMNDLGYAEKTIKEVGNIILTHSCRGKMPTTVEGRVLATADAMAHYTGDFFLRIALLGGMTMEEYKDWALEKLDTNYNVKISFNFARKYIKERHNIIKKFIEGLEGK